MEKENRLLIAIFLSFLVLYAYQVFVLKPASEKAKRQAATAATTPGTPSGAGPAGAGPGVAAPGLLPPAPVPAAPAAAPVAPAAPVVFDAAEHDIVVETRTIRAVFTNRGARLQSWQLKSFLDLTKKPQELVATYLPAYRARPFDLKVDDPAATEALRTALFRASAGADGPVAVVGRPETLTFEYQDASGLSARKEFTFEPDGYIVRVAVSVQAGGRALNPTVLWGLGLGDQVPGAAASRYIQKPEGIIVRGDKVQRLTPQEMDRQPVQEGDVTGAGVDTHYFLALAMPVRTLRTEYWRAVMPAPPGVDPARAADLVGFGVRQAQSMSNVKFYVGPKDFDILKATDPRLVRVINFGMFDILVVPLLGALKWIHAYVGNYGWSIIILTLLINIVLFPFRHKSMVSMRKMQEIQPLVKAIQDRYAGLKATDPAKQKMNSEMMSLYKEKGVNPAGGCIPMLLTMPVLFAFYSLLSQAIEIRGEPFIWWIKDLSAQDPYFVTPILMGASQFWQQRMTPPAGGDPVQQKMMMMMPLVFTFMFLWMPSGLTVYWFFSNLLAIGQQYLTNHLVGPPNAPRPPAERKMKTSSASSSGLAGR